MASGGSSPKPQVVAPAPKEQDKFVQEANAEAIRRKQRQRGYRSTMISNDMMSEEVRQRLETLGS
jgi:hypothetical protein